MKPQDIFDKKIFISPLDWGLGHCARIIPIIDLLEKNGNQIFIGVNSQQKLFFEREEKKYQLIPFDGYDFKIPKKNWELNFALQSPSLAKKLKKERLELDKLMAEHQFDIVVSDHRYGLYHSGATSVFLTHQLTLPADFFAKSINAIHQKKMLNFDFVWVLDNNKSEFAGELSSTNNKKVIFIGPVSRFFHVESDNKYDSICIVSGPEPHREEYSQKMKSILTHLKGNHILFDANPQIEEVKKIGNLTIISHGNTFDLNQYINQSNLIFSRSGYTTLMDILILGLGKRAILTPTPGQGEQEYLARYHAKKNQLISSVPQKELNLEKINTILSQE